MRNLIFLLAAAALPALAQEQDIQRQLILRPQQLRPENVSASQLIEVKPDTPQALRALDRQKAEDERLPLTYPAKEIPQRSGDAPRPLPGPPGGIIQVIEAPR